VHDQDHADRPVADPARIVEDEHPDDDIAKRDAHETRNDHAAVLAPLQSERQATEIADERQMQKDQDRIEREPKGIARQPLPRLLELMGDIGEKDLDEIPADLLRGIDGARPQRSGELLHRDRHAAMEGKNVETTADRNRRNCSGQHNSAQTDAAIGQRPQQHDQPNGRDIEQQMQMMNEQENA
jgi:hypothetical protein